MATNRPRAPGRGKKRKGRDWSSVNVERFMEEGFNDLSESEEEEEELKATAKRKKKIQSSASGHRGQLSSLKDKDQEFYKYLKENDPDLLEFEMSEGEEQNTTSEDEDVLPEPVPPTVSSYATNVHQSDGDDDILSTDDDDQEGVSRSQGGVVEEDKLDEDIEDAEEMDEGIPVSTLMVKGWVRESTKDGSVAAMKNIISALHAGVVRMAGERDEVLQYSVEDGQVFNSLLVATLKHVKEFFTNFLKLKKNSEKANPSSSSKWSKVKTTMKTYTCDLILLLKNLSDVATLSAILKQIHSLSQFYVLYPKTLQVLMKQLVVCWSEGEEQVRILAFLNIRKYTILQTHPALNKVMKRMYLAFVRNCKLTTVTTLPAIHLMEQSIVELCRLDPPTTYRHAFVYIRQLAIHLRGALSSKSKDSIQPISNWQYLHCLELWSKVLTEVKHDSLQPLVFPLVQITLGMLQLLHANKYIPLQLHCLSYLLKLSEERGVFIPIAPHLLSVMRIKTSSKRHNNGQLMGKPLDLSCMIKLSSEQLSSSSVQSSVLDRSYELLLEYFAIHSHTISFPEFSLPTLIALRKVVKETQFSWFVRQVKQLIEKVETVSSEVEKSRSRVQFAPKDLQEVEIWERERKDQQNVLKTFLLLWKQLRQKHEEEHDSAVTARATQTGKHKKFKGKTSGGIDKRKSGSIDKKKSGSSDKKKSGSIDKKKSGSSDKKKSGSIDKKKSGSSDKKKSGSIDKQSRSVDKKKSQNEDVITDMFPL